MMKFKLKDLLSPAAMIEKWGDKVVMVWLFWPRLVLRSLQVVFALVVCVIYGMRVGSDHHNGIEQDPAWEFALVVGGLSILSSFILLIINPIILSCKLFIWDFLLFLLWVGLFGTFAAIYLPQPDDVEEHRGSKVSRMKRAVWVDFIPCILWLMSGTFGCIIYFALKKANQKSRELQQRGEDKAREIRDEGQARAEESLEGRAPGRLDQVKAAQKEYDPDGKYAKMATDFVKAKLKDRKK